MAKAKIQSAGGIGESRMFGGTPHPEGTGVDRILQCHINGVAIGELNLDPHVLGALDYWSTDEGIQERNSRPDVREPSGVQLGADGFDKSLQQRRDDVRDRDMDLYQARDPLKEVADQYAIPGMKAKFLSKKRIQENGGTGDYQVVKDATGNPVQVRGMVLGHVPEARAKSRNRHFRNKSVTLLDEIGKKFKEQVGKSAVADQ